MTASTLPQPQSAKYAEHIRALQEPILERWIGLIQSDSRIPSTDKVGEQDLRDHLPQVLDELCRFLAQQASPEVSTGLDQYADIHGTQRWLQGYALEEVVMEIDRFQKLLLIDVLAEFGATQPDVDVSVQREIEHCTQDFFREMMVRSVVKFSDEASRSLNEANQSLGDAYSRVDKLNQTLRITEARLQELSLTDPLTEIANRRQFDSELVTEVARSKRHANSLTLVMMDLDHFKAINDTHGHEVGDAVLKEVAVRLESQSRATDLAARFGGEEFVLLLRDTDLHEASTIVERLRSTLSHSLIEPLGGALTASFGMAQLGDGEDGTSLLARADRAMYRAKSAGRNTVVYDPPWVRS